MGEGFILIIISYYIIRPRIKDIRSSKKSRTKMRHKGKRIFRTAKSSGYNEKGAFIIYIYCTGRLKKFNCKLK